MSLTEVRNVVLLFSNPILPDGKTTPSTIIRNITSLTSQLAYSEHITENITTLSTSYGPTKNGIIQGLMYVPDLEQDDPCHETANTYIPQNVTRRANLPMTNYNLVALAPWISTECTKSFFASVKKDSLRALLVYHPDYGDPLRPPEADDDIWDFDDGENWKSNDHFPVYAISNAAGNRMMQQLSLYSGDLSQVPFGKNITATFHPDPADYVRVWTELIISNNSTTLAVWLFVIIIIGVLVSVIGGTSMLMHCVQGQRRASLRRRVESGEVNLETLGIKRLKVPLEHVQTFPLFTYNYEPPMPLSPTARPSSAAQSHRNTELESEEAEHATDYQPDCQICLEQFQSRQTVIRELPCGHIFHPDCIDSFLSDISSLCPVCKASMLPRGYCPKITNGMVRRELATRRLRPRVVEPSDPEPTRARLHSWSSSVKRHIRFTTSSTKPGQSVELSEISVITRPSPIATMPGRTRELIVPVDERNSDDGRPQWKRLARNVFPGFD